MTSENKTLTPVWIAYVGGKRLDTDYEGALKRIYIHDSLDSAGTASLLFDISSADFGKDGAFAIGSEVSIHLGYKDDVHEVFTGEVTGFAPRLDEYSAPLMEVKIHSKLRSLERGTKCASFEHKTPAGIIRDIASKYGLDSDVEEFGPEYNYIEQKNFTDYGYIMYLAGKYGKTVYCNGNTVHVKTEITPTDDDVVLEWGKSLISARTKTDLSAQLSAVTATGWDMRKCAGFTATATMKDVPLKIGGEYSWEDNAKGYDSHKVGLAAQLQQFHRREGRHGGGKERSSGQVIAVPELRGKDGRQQPHKAGQQAHGEIPWKAQRRRVSCLLSGA